MANNLAGILLLLCVLAPAAAQVIRSVNGSLRLEIPGATLMMVPTDGAATADSGGAYALTSDVTATIQNTIAQTQPQVQPGMCPCVRVCK